MPLAAHWAPDCAPMTLVHIVPTSPSMIQAVDHVTVVNIRQVFCGEHLDVDLARPTQVI